MATHLLLYLKCQKLRAWQLVWRFRTTIPFSWNPFLQSIDYPASLLTLASGIFWFSGTCCYIYYDKRRFVPSIEGCLFWLRSLRGYSWSIPSSCAKIRRDAFTFSKVLSIYEYWLYNFINNHTCCYPCLVFPSVHFLLLRMAPYALCKVDY